MAHEVDLSMPISLENIEGFAAAAAKTSHTTAAGALRLTPIDGVKYRLARAVSHHHGHLTEAYRTDWGITDFPVVQVNLTSTFPGRVRAWGIHRFTIDRLFAATGSLCIVCYDGRPDSPTFGAVNEFMDGVGANRSLRYPSSQRRRGPLAAGRRRCRVLDTAIVE